MEELLIQAELLRNSNPEQALVIYSQVYDADPNNFWAGFWQALMTKWNVSNEQSIELFEEMLVTFPDSDLVRTELAQNLVETRRYSAALEVLAQIEDAEYLSRAQDIRNQIYDTDYTVSFSTNSFRPDDENAFTFSASALWRIPGSDADLTATTSERFWVDGTDVFTARLDYQTGDILLRAGLHLIDDAAIPNLGIEYAILDSADGGTGLKLRYEYRINDSDPQAVVEKITQNVLGLEYYREGFYVGSEFQLNSDDVLVTETFTEIRLTENNALALIGYLRTASEDSDFYWTPETFANVGLRIAVPLGNSCTAGIAPGFKYEDDNEINGDVDFTLPFGAQCNFNNTSLSFRYDYGLNFEVRQSF